ncbi:MAG: hypothetical protein K0S30_511 [Clostridia bacterium]|nr:hypothetical protein [Clostridia bacterium]
MFIEYDNKKCYDSDGKRNSDNKNNILQGRKYIMSNCVLFYF